VGLLLIKPLCTLYNKGVKKSDSSSQELPAAPAAAYYDPFLVTYDYSSKEGNQLGNI